MKTRITLHEDDPLSLSMVWYRDRQRGDTTTYISITTFLRWRRIEVQWQQMQDEMRKVIDGRSGA